MRQARLISIAAIALLGLTGCNALQRALPGGQDTSSQPDPTVDPDPTVVIDSGEAGQDGTTEGETAQGESTEIASASTPADGEDSAPVGAVPLDLITSTNPNTRAQQVQRDRPDPFSLLPSAPTVEVPETTTQSQGSQSQGSQSQGSQSQGSPGSAQSGGSSQTAAAGANSGSSTEGAAGSDGAAAGPVIPLPPPTTLARAVEVTGVVQIGAVPYAIVRAPNEPTSRYVRAGQSLSNGAVLVKRIDSFAGLEPTVVLEQNGIEVVRGVEAPPASDDTETAQAPDAPVS